MLASTFIYLLRAIVILGITDLKNSVFLQGANIAGAIVTIVVNALANILALNGRNTGEISNLYPTLITPAGYVFSIWGLIYALLIGFVAFQALPRQREKQFLSQISFLFVLSCMLNISWLFLWHYGQIVLSTIPMFALLITLVAIYLRLDIGRAMIPFKERVFIHLPFSVYLGWITVAAIANVAVALTAINWGGWGLGNTAWAVIMIIVALFINLAVIGMRRDLAYSLVIIWALIGIIVKQAVNPSITITAGVGIIIIVGALMIKVLGIGIDKIMR